MRPAGHILDELLNNSSFNLSSADSVLESFSGISDLCISMPLSDGMATCAGPGVPVGATQAQKARPNGPKWLRSGKPEWPGQSSLAGRFSRAVGVMETAGNRRKSAQPQVKSSI